MSGLSTRRAVGVKILIERYGHVGEEAVSFKKRIVFFVVGLALSVLTMNLVFGSEAHAQTPEQNAQILASVKAWVAGRYSSEEQVERDLANDVPDHLQHRLMYQLFAPVDVDFADGVFVYQQSSMDGSDDPEWVTRKGLLHFYINEGTGHVHQRELAFKAADQFVNVHKDPTVLAELSMDDFTWRNGCDFQLTLEPGGQAISGPMDFGSCRMENPGSGEDMVAEDKIRITPDEYWFLGRYLNAEGRVVWGTESDEMNKLKRVAALEIDGGVLVFGGTRATGLEIVKLLADRGETVTVFVRETSDRSQLVPLGVAFAVGDALDAQSVKEAFGQANFRAVISSLGSRRGDSPVDDVGTINVTDAAKAAGVDRILMVSSLGAGESRDLLPFYVKWILGAGLDRKTTAENHIRASGLDYTIIRPGGLQDAPATGTGILIEEGQPIKVKSIPRAEVARLLVKAFDDPASVGKVYHTVPNAQ